MDAVTNVPQPVNEPVHDYAPQPVNEPVHDYAPGQPGKGSR